MQGSRNAALNDKTRGPGANSRDLPVSSRRDALERLRRTLGCEDAAMALLTGEPGTGKTWLWRRLVKELPVNWFSLSVDMSAALDALEFSRLIAHGLGIKLADRLGTARLDVAGSLRDQSSDGRSWLLVVENAQNTSAQVWNEIQVMVHAAEAGEGFAAVLLVGPTELAHMLASRSMSFLSTRIRTHIHLLCLDLDEWLELAQSRGGSDHLDRSILEELHRDARGNPRRLLQLLRDRSWWTDVATEGTQPGRLQKIPDPSPRQLPAGARADAIAERVVGESSGTSREYGGRAPDGAVGAGESGPTVSALVPSRPPLRIEEGLIEVGWGGSLEAEAGVSTGEADAPLDEVSGAVGRKESPGEELIEENERELPSEEMIEDHYAALQAWTEWAKNRGRSLSPSGTAGNEQLERVQGSKIPLVRAKDEQVSEEFSAQGLRPELQHEHAPYSQLFSRLRQSS